MALVKHISKNVKFASCVSAIFLLLNVFASTRAYNFDYSNYDLKAFIQYSLQNATVQLISLKQTNEVQKTAKYFNSNSLGFTPSSIEILLKYYEVRRYLDYSISYLFTRLYIFPFHSFW